MNREREVEITEERRGLTLVICLLVVLGYLILHYLGGSGAAPAIEVRTQVSAEPPLEPPAAAPQADEQPHVLTVERSDAPEEVQRSAAEDDGTLR
jgi:hypothetical protein